MNAHQTMLLHRFERLLNMQRDYVDDLNATGMMMLVRATTSTYLDCIEAGCDEEADRLARMIGANERKA